MDILFLILGLVLILGGATILTDGSVALAQRFRIPEFIVGITVIGVGTSTPELVISLLSAMAGKSDMAIGNVVGSNIFNIFVILGICALIRPVPLTGSNIRRDIPFVLLASLILLGTLAETLIWPGTPPRVTRGEGIVMLCMYIALLWYTIRGEHRSQKMPSTPPVETAPTPTKPPMKGWLMALMIVGGLAGLIIGGDLFLRGATHFARMLGLSESVIAITLVAGGTSLPELGSSVVSMIKGKTTLALGNVVGSNIANILLVLGLSASIHPLPLGNITLWDILMTVLGAVLLFVSAFTFRKKAIDRWEGVLFLAIYAGYLWWLIK